MGPNQSSWTVPCWSTALDTTTRERTTDTCSCAEWFGPFWMPRNSTVDVLCDSDAWTTCPLNDLLNTSSVLLSSGESAWNALTDAGCASHWCAKPFTRLGTFSRLTSKVMHQQLRWHWLSSTHLNANLVVASSPHAKGDHVDASEGCRQPCRPRKQTLVGSKRLDQATMWTHVHSFRFESRDGRSTLSLRATL